jgi:hypothetical protein
VCDERARIHEKKLYSTYMGGEGVNLRANCFASDGSIWVAGHSPGPNWPLKNAYPNVRKSGLVLAKFKPVPATMDKYQP